MFGRRVRFINAFLLHINAEFGFLHLFCHLGKMSVTDKKFEFLELQKRIHLLHIQKVTKSETCDYL